MGDKNFHNNFFHTHLMGHLQHYLRSMKKQLLFLILTLLVSINSSAVNVTFQVDMNYAPAFDTVFIAADFQGWCANCTPLSDPQGDGTWSVTLDVPIGPHEYKFTLGNWTNNVEDLFGSGPCSIAAPGNRTINITGPTVVPLVCYNSCYSCDQTPHDVHFSIDMNYVPAFDDPNYPEQVYIYGDFNGWCFTCDPLSDINNDGIWEITKSITNGTYQYKYTHSTDNAGSEGFTQSGPCTTTGQQYNNRILNVSSDTTLTTYCFNSCQTCAEITHEVTFQVDMNYFDLPFTTPAVIGGFNNACGNCDQLQDPDGDNIWELTTTILEGDYEYKFTTDNNTHYEELDINDECVVAPFGYTNRYLHLVNDTILPLVCWAQCASCDDIVKSVTFQLDLSPYSGFIAPEINGGFNQWNATNCCASMTDEDGNGIWQETILLLPGYYEYKYSIDHHTYWEGLASASACAIDYINYSNRFLNLANDTILPPVCWEECISCTPPAPETLAINNVNPGEIFTYELFSVSFETNNTTFDAGNIFTLELSGLDGTFNEPLLLGTINGTSAGTFENLSVPFNLPANCYRLRVLSSSPADSSSGWNEIKINSLTAEPGNYALSFDGLNDYANLGGALPEGDFSISFWVKPNSEGNQAGNLGGIADIQHDLYLYGNPDVEGNFILSHLLQFDLLQDQWNHVTVTMDAANSLRKVYVFGQLIDQSTWTYAPDVNHQLLLGSTTCGFCGGAYNGLMDEVKIWDHVLTADNVFSQMQTQLNGDEAGLVGYYTFNEGCQIEVVDASPNHNDGVLMNGTQRIISDVPVWETNIVPNEGGNINVVNVTISDFYTSNVVSAALILSGFPTITTTEVYMQSGMLSCIASWDLTGVQIGLYDIVLTLENGSVKTYPSAYNVIEGVLPEVWVDIVGRNVWRNGRPFNFLITYGNTGNVDAKGVPLYVIIKGDTLINVQKNFNMLAPSNADAQWLVDSIPTAYNYDVFGDEAGEFIVMPFYIPIIRAGEIGTLSFSLTNLGEVDLEFTAYTTKPHYASPLDPDVSDCLSGLLNTGLDAALSGVVEAIPGVECMIGAYDAGSAIMNYLDGGAGAGSTAWNVVSGLAGGCASLIPAVGAAKLAKVIIKTGVDAVNTGINVYNCGKALTPKAPKKQQAGPVNSFDPNEKIGPSNFQNLGHDFNYAVYFENIETASAAAQQVLIFDTLDINTLDVNSFEFGGIGFGRIFRENTAIDKSHLNLEIDLRPEKDLILGVSGQVNLETGVATWQFTSLDPATMQLTEDPILGFLDPNDDSGRGQGFVQYNIAPRGTLQTGDSISNKATIIFDYNSPIVTNTWTNTIDLVAPVSAVVGLPDETNQPVFSVSWNGADPEISGVESYKVFVKENDGEYVLWLDNYHDTVAYFTGYTETWYSFYTIAKDSAGNIEEEPNFADDSTYVFFTYYEPVIYLGSTNVQCAGNADGLIDLTVEGGNQPFTFQLNGQPSDGNLTGLAPGNYHLVITNDLQMIDLDTMIVITEPTQLIAQNTIIPASAGGACDGEIQVVVEGGTGDYTIVWNDPNESSVFTLSNLCAGNYSAVITDENGCEVNIDAATVGVGISEVKNELGLRVTPNPATTGINIQISSNNIEKRYRIFDAAGKQVASGKLQTQNTLIDISNLSKGVYQIEVNNESLSFIKE